MWCVGPRVYYLVVGLKKSCNSLIGIINFFNRRYSYFHKLIPLLLTGLSDDIQEIRKKSSDLFDKVYAYILTKILVENACVKPN